MASTIIFLTFMILYQTAAMVITLDANDKYNVSWTYNDKNITFTISAETKGWVGLGFSPNGGMKGSDIIIAWVDNGKVYLEDRFATSNTLPKIDLSRDTILMSGTEVNGVTTVTFTRKLDTCDKDNDHKITSDTTKLIYAYGLTDPTNNKFSSSDYHDTTRRGTKSVYLLDPPSKQSDIPADAQTYDMTADTVIPEDKTTYYCTFFHGPNVTTKHHVIATEPIVTPGNEGIVHHIVVYACHGVDKMHIRNSNKTDGVCFTQEMPEFANRCRSPIFVWAVGGTKFYFPDHTGYPIGDDTSPQFYMMETHYDNPSQISGRRDTSGMRITYTPTLRKNDVDLLTVGLVGGIFVPPKSENFKVHSYCTGDCTNEWIPESGINVFGFMLHAHLLGRDIKVNWYRNGQELEPLAKDNHYDFNFQENRLLSSEKKLMPGDSLKVVCSMNSQDRDNVTYGGLATRNEMCEAFLMYYPKQNLSFCASDPTFLVEPENRLWSDLGIHAVHEPNKSYALPVAKYLNNITWDQQTRDLAQKAVEDSPHYTQCMQLNVINYPSNMKRFTKPDYKSYEYTDVTCKKTEDTNQRNDGSVAVSYTSSVVLVFISLIISIVSV